MGDTLAEEGGVAIEPGRGRTAIADDQIAAMAELEGQRPGMGVARRPWDRRCARPHHGRQVGHRRNQAAAQPRRIGHRGPHDAEMRRPEHLALQLGDERLGFFPFRGLSTLA